MIDSASEERLKLAEAFLQEAVYRSREAQSQQHREPAPVERLDGDAPGSRKRSSSPQNCGLGEKAVVVLDLTPRGAELFAQLWPDPPAPAAVQELRAVVTDWVRRQDALDRKRNHFLKDFRREHGFDRTLYTDEQSSAYRSGLDAINAEVDATRRAAAQSLLKSA